MREMREYVLARARALRRIGFAVEPSDLWSRAERDSKFLSLWTLWKRSGWARGLAPSFFAEENRWGTTSEKLTILNLNRHESAGVDRVGGRWRARSYRGGAESFIGCFGTEEEALDAAKRARRAL